MNTEKTSDLSTSLENLAIAAPVFSWNKYSQKQFKFYHDRIEYCSHLCTILETLAVDLDLPKTSAPKT